MEKGRGKIELLDPEGYIFEIQRRHVMAHDLERPPSTRPDLIDIYDNYNFYFTAATPPYLLLMHESYNEVRDSYEGVFGRRRVPKPKSEDVVTIKSSLERISSKFKMKKKFTGSYPTTSAHYQAERIRTLVQQRHSHWQQPVCYMRPMTNERGELRTHLFATEPIKKDGVIGLAYGVFEDVTSTVNAMEHLYSSERYDAAYFAVPDNIEDFYEALDNPSFYMIRGFERRSGLEPGKFDIFNVFSFLKYATEPDMGNVKMGILPVLVHPVGKNADTDPKILHPFLYCYATRQIEQDEELLLDPFWLTTSFRHQLTFYYTALGRQQLGTEQQSSQIDTPPVLRERVAKRIVELEAGRKSNVGDRTRAVKTKRGTRDDEKEEDSRETKRSKQRPGQPVVSAPESEPCSSKSVVKASTSASFYDVDDAILSLLDNPQDDPCHRSPVEDVGVQTSDSLLPVCPEAEPSPVEGNEIIPLRARVEERRGRAKEMSRRGLLVTDIPEDFVFVRNYPDGSFPTITPFPNLREVGESGDPLFEEEWKSLTFQFNEMHLDRMASPFMGLLANESVPNVDIEGIIIYDTEVYLPADAIGKENLQDIEFSTTYHYPSEKDQFRINLCRERMRRMFLKPDLETHRDAEVESMTKMLQRSFNCSVVHESVDESVEDLIAKMKRIRDDTLQRVQKGLSKGKKLVILCAFSTYVYRKVMRLGDRKLVDLFGLLHEIFGPRPSVPQFIKPLLIWPGSQGNLEPSQSNKETPSTIILWPSKQSTTCGLNEILLNLNCLNICVRGMSSNDGDNATLKQAVVTKILQLHLDFCGKQDEPDVCESYDNRPCPTFLLSGNANVMSMDVLAREERKSQHTDIHLDSRDSIGIHFIEWKHPDVIDNIAAILFQVSQVFKSFGLVNNTRHVFIRNRTEQEMETDALSLRIKESPVTNVMLVVTSMAAAEDHVEVGDEVDIIHVTYPKFVAYLNKETGRNLSYFILANHPGGAYKSYPIHVATRGGVCEFQTSGCRFACIDLCEPQSYNGSIGYKGKSVPCIYPLAHLCEIIHRTYDNGLGFDPFSATGCINLYDIIRCIYRRNYHGHSRVVASLEENGRVGIDLQYGNYQAWPSLICSLTNEDDPSSPLLRELDALVLRTTRDSKTSETPRENPPRYWTREKFDLELDLLRSQTRTGVLDYENVPAVVQMMTPVVNQLELIMENADPETVIATNDNEQPLTIGKLKRTHSSAEKFDVLLMNYYTPLVEKWSFRQSTHPRVVILPHKVAATEQAQGFPINPIFEIMAKKMAVFSSMDADVEDFYILVFPIPEGEHVWSLVVYKPKEHKIVHFQNRRENCATTYDLSEAKREIDAFHEFAVTCANKKPKPKSESAKIEIVDFTGSLTQDASCGAVVAMIINSMAFGLDPPNLTEDKHACQVLLRHQLLLQEFI